MVRVRVTNRKAIKDMARANTAGKAKLAAESKSSEEVGQEEEEEQVPEQAAQLFSSSFGGGSSRLARQAKRKEAEERQKAEGDNASSSGSSKDTLLPRSKDTYRHVLTRTGAEGKFSVQLVESGKVTFMEEEVETSELPPRAVITRAMPGVQETQWTKSLDSRAKPMKVRRAHPPAPACPAPRPSPQAGPPRGTPAPTPNPPQAYNLDSLYGVAPPHQTDRNPNSLYFT